MQMQSSGVNAGRLAPEQALWTSSRLERLLEHTNRKRCLELPEQCLTQQRRLCGQQQRADRDVDRAGAVRTWKLAGDLTDPPECG